MKTFPTLYKLTEVGNIQQWEVVVKNKSFYSREGIIGGKITENKPTFCEGKNAGKSNETSGEEQALKEAEAKHKKKIEKGYFLSAKEAQKGISKFYEPMLAHKFEDYRNEIQFPVYSQMKLDGIRCVVSKDGMASRNGKKIISAPHIFEALKPFFVKNPNAVLDGELYTDKLNNDFNKICSLVKRTKPTAEELAESAATIEYWVYDAPIIGAYTEEDSFGERFNLVQSLLKDINKIKIVKTDLVNNITLLDEFYGTYLEDGYEGQMIRLNKSYENKRSKFLLKRKEFIDEEYKIIDIVEGVGNRAGTAGYMKFVSKNGKSFHSNIKGNFQYLKTILSNKNKLIGKMATVKYFNLTPDGVPRFPYVTGIRDYE